MIKKKISEIEGFEEYDMFEVHSDGSIVSHRREEPIILNGYDDGKGYLQIDLHYKNKRGVRIHRLVALAFIPNPDNKPQVNHINGIKTDNRVINLEWVTNSENQTHSNKLGLRNYQYDHSKEHTNIMQYSLDDTFIKQYISIGNACIDVFGEYNKTKISNIYKCCTGKSKTAYGYKWSFK